jgi:hypothetical protein
MWDRSKAVHTVQAGEGDPAATIGISDMVARLGHGGNRKLGGGFTSVSGVALQAASHFWALALLLAGSLARPRSGNTFVGCKGVFGTPPERDDLFCLRRHPFGLYRHDRETVTLRGIEACSVVKHTNNTRSLHAAIMISSGGRQRGKANIGNTSGVGKFARAEK